MTAPVKSGVRRKRTLPVYGAAGRIERHPRDGWQRAKPYRVGRRTRRALRGLIWAMCPPAPRFPGFTARIELGVRRLMPYMSPLTAAVMAAMMLLLDWAPRLMLVSTRLLHQLSPSEGARVLDRLAHSRWHWMRTLVVAIRGSILSVYFDQDEVHRALNYTPVPFINERIALRNQLLGTKKALAS
jgi:hypothetical protein